MADAQSSDAAQARPSTEDRVVIMDDRMNAGSYILWGFAILAVAVVAFYLGWFL